ncbi:CHAT domain-containing protein [Solihabitans fulvus]|uniref:CHAT domain-containing protein n=1 Tax=Solihabitans fulvus TaxID=1892852 RepID=A0A5B2W6W9_9PSEU|nr:CHAT domain-containing protein [Solihabitans fulvus]KAA2247673.1 CHAT domain-containing protein [Solihabitans fulvus]
MDGQALARVRDRVRSHASGGQQDAVLGSAALLDAAQLVLDAVDRLSADAPAGLAVPVAHAVANLHWARWSLLPEDRGAADFHTAFCLFTVLRAADPRMVPAALARSFAAQPPEQQPPHEILHAVGAVLAGEYGHDPDEDLALYATVLFGQAVKLVPASDPARPVLLFDFGLALRRLADHTGDEDSLRAAAEYLWQGASALRTDPARIAAAWAEVGDTLNLVFDSTKRLSHLDGALAAHRAAVAAVPDVAAHARVGADLWRRYQLTARPDLLEGAAAAFLAAARLAPDTHPLRPGVLSSLATALLERGAITRDLALVAEAVAVAEAAVTSVTAGTAKHHDGIAVADNLVALHEILARARRDGVLPESVARPDNADLAGDRAAAADGLVRDFGRAGDPADLDLAVQLADWALGAPVLDTATAAVALGAIARADLMRFQLFGDPAELDTAAGAAKRAVDLSRPDAPERADRLATLGSVLRTRFEVVGDLRDLDAALAALAAAVGSLRQGHPAYAEVRSAHGAALLARFAVSREPALLASALAATGAAVGATSADDPAYASFLTRHGRALAARFEQTGEPAQLAAAVAAQAAAVEASPPTHPEHAMTRWSLAAVLRSRWQLTGDPADRDRAAALLGDALAALPADDPRRGLALTELADTVADPAESIAAYRAAAWCAPAFTRVRLTAARRYGELSLARGDHAAALAGYRLAIQDLLPRLVDGRPTEDSRRRDAETFPWLASDAAAAAIAAGEPEEGLRLLEQGRSIRWARALELRGEHEDLRAAHPAQAARFAEVRAALSAEVGRVASAAGRGRAGRHDRLLAEIRELPGFAGFLRPPSSDRLRAAASGGPVAVVNLSRQRCDALLLVPGRADVLVCPLPEVTAQDVAHRSGEFAGALRLLGAPDTDQAARTKGEDVVLSTLEWLWDEIAEPVLTELGLCAAVEDGAEWPRLRWCPTGPLAALPLHAAGRHGVDQDGAWVGDRVVSSYAPTLTALLRKDSRRSDGPPRVLGVGLAHTRGGPPLASAQAELAALRELFGARVAPLVGSRATRSAILAALPNHPVAHFACHGRHDPDDPAAAHLVVHDGPLPLRDLAGADLTSAELAFLSACDTVDGRPSTFGDEPIHFAAACQLAGYRQVVGALWHLADESGPILTREVYASLADGASFDPALALHLAVRGLRRDDRFAAPSHWARFVHIGPS